MAVSIYRSYNVSIAHPAELIAALQAQLDAGGAVRMELCLTESHDGTGGWIHINKPDGTEDDRGPFDLDVSLAEWEKEDSDTGYLKSGTLPVYDKPPTAILMCGTCKEREAVWINEVWGFGACCNECEEQANGQDWVRSERVNG